MIRKAAAARLCAWVACFVILPTAAVAQSAIGGVVTDNTGGVLPGVTVETASPALIEGSRVAVTDGEGRYLVVELRPGTYTVTFALPGFNTVIREGLELPADFTSTVNVQLGVGSLEESVTVTGESPVVDVLRTQRQQVLDRELMDILPTGNTMGGQAMLIPAIRPHVIEVGSSRSIQGTYMTAYGSDIRQNTLTVDGMSIQSNDCDGICFGYYNDRAFSETTFDFAGASAETPRGGVRVNMIPEEGGNTFSGLGYLMGADKAWQADNLTDRLQDLGITSVNRYERIFDVNLTQGGPIKRDKLWFFGAYRNWRVDNPVVDSFYKLPDGSPDFSRPGIDDSQIFSLLLRQTWQVTPRNKFSVYFDRTWKYRYHQHSAGDDIETASQFYDYPLNYIGQAKWTSTVGSRMLVELGYGSRAITRHHLYQEGIKKEPGTPEWYAQASRVDRTLGTRTAAMVAERLSKSKRFVYLAKVSYVTGSHNFKAGFETNFGPVINTRNKNADLDQEYRNGIPDTVRVSNTPIWTEAYADGDNAFFVQDSWTRDRLTLNGGVRWEWLNTRIPATELFGGRFVGLRRFDQQKDLPDWSDVSPRFGLAYDLFGTGQTALKFSINKYMAGAITEFAEDYSPMALVRRRLPWDDLNGDDIAQGELGCTYPTAGVCEFDTSLLPANFGEAVLSRPDPEIQRTWNLLTTVGVDHELRPGVSVSGSFVRRTFYDLTESTNLLRSLADYTPVTIVNPLNGLPITVWNLNSRSLLAHEDNFDTNAITELPAGHPYAGLDRSQVYTGFDFTVNGRLPAGATVFGGWTVQRTTSVDCDSLDDPNSFRFCNRGGGLDAESGVAIDMPFRHVFKMSGTVPLPYGVGFAVSFQSYPGCVTAAWGRCEDPLNWIISRNTRYPSPEIMARTGAAGCVGCEDLVGLPVIPQLNQSSVTVPLATPGERYPERNNLLSISATKQVDLGAVRLEFQADVFNLLNTDSIEVLRTTLGSRYGQPTRVLWARYLELATRVRW